MFEMNSLFLVLYLTFTLSYVKIANSECSQLVATAPKSRGLNIKSNMIEIHVNTKITKSHKPAIHIAFDPPLTFRQDYDINYMIAENSLPYYHNPRKHFLNTTSIIGISLLPGKVWIRNISESKELYIVSIFQCSSQDEVVSYKGFEQVRVRIAAFSPQHPICPAIPLLPDANPAFTSLLQEVLGNCSNLRIIKSKRLHQHHMTSLSLLSPNMQVLLIDGSDQHNITDAAREVDKFLGPHSVLDLAWEPYNDNEPKWFVLIPHPRGLPGHLFAMIDHVQFDHPAVTTARRHNELPQCNSTFRDINKCDLGCPGTFLHRLTASGYGADSWHLMLDTRRALLWNEPIQPVPMRLGNPKMGGPDWQGQLGWTYTYGGCPTNFLDCYFLSHTPCPMLTVDAEEVLLHQHNSIARNRTRMKNWNLKNIGKVDDIAFRNADLWWDSVMASEPSTDDNYIPHQAVDGHHSKAAEQAFYTYMWRPNYQLRKEIHRRVRNFNLQESCAAMHVRRGDVVHHGGQSRAYIRVESYVRAARPLMNAMQIKTILLFTDSQSAIEEAHNCTRDYPDVCEGIKFRYVEKKRWYGAEGGWENPFPSGSPQQEMYAIQQEFALTQKCQMMIMGNSNYADKLHFHMCCGFPMHDRGRLPQRCICPPKIQVSQSGFGSCEEGNILLCKDKSADRNTFTAPGSHNIARAPRDVRLENYKDGFHYNPQDTPESLKPRIEAYVKESVALACKKYDHGPPRGDFCKAHGL